MSKSIRNNTRLLKGDSSLSNIQERLTCSTFPLLELISIGNLQSHDGENEVDRG